LSLGAGVAGQDILRKEPMSRDVNKNNTFHFNDKFQSRDGYAPTTCSYIQGQYSADAMRLYMILIKKFHIIQHEENKTSYRLSYLRLTTQGPVTGTHTSPNNLLCLSTWFG